MPEICCICQGCLHYSECYAAECLIFCNDDSLCNVCLVGCEYFEYSV